MNHPYSKVSALMFWLVALFLMLPACSKKQVDYQSDKERLKEYVLDAAPEGVKPLDIDFSGQVQLIGYTLSPGGRVRRGKNVELSLYWRVLAPVEKGYHLFTHLLDGSGERIASLDTTGPLREIQEGRPALPPEAWDQGKIYVDTQTFRVPSSVKTARVQLVAGLQRGADRLPIRSGPKDSAGRGLVASLPLAAKRRRVRQKPVPELSVTKLESPSLIKIDGVLDEAAWQSASSVRLVDVSTGKPNRTFPVNATVKLLWSDVGFYVAFDVQDPDLVGGFPKNAKDPHLWTRDAVEIMVDPDGDGDNLDYYEIQIGPQNLVFDSQFDKYNEPTQEPDGPFGHQQWSSRVTSAVTLRGTLDQPGDKDEGYVVEAVLPWKSFTKAKRIPPAIGDTWRLNFYAIENNSGVAWSPILNEGNFHKASRFGRVTWTGEAPVARAAEPSTGAVGARLEAPDAGRLRRPDLTRPIQHPMGSAAPATAAPAQ